MAYADNNTNDRKLSTGAAVLLLEAGLAWAVITGLTMNYTRKPMPKNPDAMNFPLPEVTPTEQPKVTPQTQPTEAARPIVDRPFDLGTATLPPQVDDSTLGDGGGKAVIELPRPEPVPSPRPSFTPKTARPAGKTGNWVTTNDYPTRELREEREGTTSYRLAINAEGRVTNCSVTSSSGSAGLDRAACDNLQRRARFEPASDESGSRTAGSYSGTVTWRIPEE